MVAVMHLFDETVISSHWTRTET